MKDTTIHWYDALIRFGDVIGFAGNIPTSLKIITDAPTGKKKVHLEPLTIAINSYGDRVQIFQYVEEWLLEVKEPAQSHPKVHWNPEQNEVYFKWIQKAFRSDEWEFLASEHKKLYFQIRLEECPFLGFEKVIFPDGSVKVGLNLEFTVLIKNPWDRDTTVEGSLQYQLTYSKPSHEIIKPDSYLIFFRGFSYPAKLEAEQV